MMRQMTVMIGITEPIRQYPAMLLVASLNPVRYLSPVKTVSRRWLEVGAAVLQLPITSRSPRALPRQSRTACVPGMAPLVSMMSSVAGNAAPPLAVTGRAAVYENDDDRLMNLVSRAVALSQNGTCMDDSRIARIQELLERIVDLIEAMDLTVSIDIRDVKKKLTDLEKRSGYTLRTT